MKVKQVLISSLAIDPKNARRHGDRNLESIKKSLERFGQVKPIVIDSNNVVRAGNGTLTAAIALGWDKISVIQSDLPAAELAAYAVADNRTAELAEWDDGMLAETLKELQAADDALLAATGFSDEDFAKLLEPAAMEATEPAPATRTRGGNGLGTPVIQYAIIFDTEDQQKRWFDFIRGLKQKFPELDTLAKRLDAFLAGEAAISSPVKSVA
jgi:ParB-like nuclease domain